jgi:Tol biopolymer transport system component/tRNA A-37 threonylcarbamoyl transferase component Bud32
MTGDMERLATALQDRYKILRRLGEGGMATVYLAEDLKHEREVAIKVLKPELAAALGPDRFLREIRIAANLTHPHILPLHDSGETDGFLYYVMPFIDGQTLRERIDKEGELPVSEVVRIVRGVIDALAFAHSKGVVHRDIKPDNVMLAGGHAIVADFGVAKAVSEAKGGDQLTTAGVALGTPAYMAPEQATADPNLDHRADIYALGAMAYELLTGRPPFMGASPQAILAAHVTDQVEPVTKYRDQVSGELEAVVMKCLAKKPADRWQWAGDIVPYLETMATSSGGLTPAVSMSVAGQKPRSKSLLAVAGVLLVIVAGWAGRSFFAEESLAITVLRSTQLTRSAGLEVDPAISPDGREVAFVAGAFGRMRLYLQDTQGRSAAELAPDLDEDQRSPRWSADGRNVFFTYGSSAEGSIRAVSRSGGAVAELADDGSTIHFAEMRDSVTAVGFDSGLLLRFDVRTREPEYIVADRVGPDPHSPKVSPDGRLVAFVDRNAAWQLAANYAPSSVIVVPMQEGDVETVEISSGSFPKWNGIPVAVTDSVSMNFSPVWLPDSRHLLFVSDRDGSRDIYMQRVNSAGEADGTASRITVGADAHSISISDDGRSVAYSRFALRRNVWQIPIPRSGSVSIGEATMITSGNQVIETPSGSPDGEWFAYDSDVSGNFDIYRQLVDGGPPVQITRDPAADFYPNWSPDGQEIVFHSTRTGNRDIFVMDAFGGDPPTQVTTSPDEQRNPSWGPDGNSIIFSRNLGGIYVVRRDGRDEPWGDPELVVGGGGQNPRISPDGNWIADGGGGVVAIRNSQGEWTILVDPSSGRFANTGSLQWSADGSKIYFWGTDMDGHRDIWAVSIQGGLPQRVVRFGEADMVWNVFGIDPTNFYFAIGRIESDIWVLELDY